MIMNKHIKAYRPILESEDANYLINRLVTDAINSIFLNKDTSVILLSFDEPDENPQNSALYDQDDSYGHESTDEYEITLDCLYIGNPELDEELKSAGLRRFTIMIMLSTSFSYTSWSDPGDRDTPGDSGTDFSDESTELLTIYFGEEELDISDVPEKFIENLKGYSFDDVHYDLVKNGKKFIP